MIALFAALLLSADPSAAAAQPQASPAATAPAAAKPAEKRICKVDTSDSTSRLRKRVCMTPTEWDRSETGKDVTDLKSMGAH